MIFDTVITMNPGNALAANVIRSRYVCHQAVMAITGDMERVLWRLETGTYPKLTVRTPRRPRLEAFLSQRYPNYAVDVQCEVTEYGHEKGQVRFISARRESHKEST